MVLHLWLSGFAQQVRLFLRIRGCNISKQPINFHLYDKTRKDYEVSQTKFLFSPPKMKYNRANKTESNFTNTYPIKMTFKKERIPVYTLMIEELKEHSKRI